MRPDPLIPNLAVVTDIRVDTPDVKTFRVVGLDGKKPFVHIPGQCAMLSVPGVGEALFSIECVNDAQNRKNANLTDEYGLLPLPKYEADGTANYYTGLQDSHNVISVVNGRSNYAAIGAVLELLSAYSYEGIRPYYVNTLAKQKYLDNLKSQKVMDLSLDGARWDFAAIYAAYLPNRDGNAPHMALWRGGCQHGNTAYRYEQHKDTWNKLLKQFDADEHFARKSAS